MTGSEEWSEDQFEAAVGAYATMLTWQRQGQQFVKRDVIRQLVAGPLRGRTIASVEYRLQNISAVMEEQGHDWLKGYVPARNVGDRGRRLILQFLHVQGVFGGQAASR